MRKFSEVIPEVGEIGSEALAVLGLEVHLDVMGELTEEFREVLGLVVIHRCLTKQRVTKVNGQ